MHRGFADQPEQFGTRLARMIASLVAQSAANIRDSRARAASRSKLAAHMNNRAAQFGQHVNPALQLVAVTPLRQQLYVVANFKETQLRRMQPGQKVVLTPTSTRAPRSRRVDSLAPATGALYSLLPPENATGNFTKVVQRVPVKIVIDPAQAEQARGCAPDCRSPPKSIRAARGRAARPVRQRGRDARRWLSHDGMPPADRLTWREWAGFMAMVFGMFMAILDIQIVSASINEIQAGLSASPDEVAWVQTSYLIAEIVMIPLSGWLSRLLSTRMLFVCQRARVHVVLVALRQRDQPGRDDGVPRCCKASSAAR